MVHKGLKGIGTPCLQSQSQLSHSLVPNPFLSDVAFAPWKQGIRHIHSERFR